MNNNSHDEKSRIRITNKITILKTYKIHRNQYTGSQLFFKLNCRKKILYKLF